MNPPDEVSDDAAAQVDAVWGQIDTTAILGQCLVECQRIRRLLDGDDTDR